MATATKLTAGQYREATVEGDRTQLIDGALVVNDPKPVHALLQVRITVALQVWAEGGAGRGLVLLPTDVVIDDHNVFGPDVLWIAERNRPVDIRSGLDRIPDLCVEIRSAGTWRYDIGAKKSAYERSGLPELWLVDDVSEAVFAFRRQTPESTEFDVALELGAGDTITSPQLPGFELPAGRLFAG